VPVRATRAFELAGYDMRMLIDANPAGGADGTGWAAPADTRAEAERPW
jgi:hypothetical protein